METSLHRQLKLRYAGQSGRVEATVDNYRIDAVRKGTLIEIQHGSLVAIRDKISRLLARHRVLVVKPIVARKTLVKQSGPQGAELSRRQSPKRGAMLDIFDELVYFTRVFPHPRLTLEVLLVEIEEFRHPGHGRRRRWRRDDHVVADQKLVEVGQSLRLKSAKDLLTLLPASLPRQFHTAQLAAALSVRRHVAQRIAYCLRKMGAIDLVGKQGNALVYQLPTRTRRRKTTAA